MPERAASHDDGVAGARALTGSRLLILGLLALAPYLLLPGKPALMDGQRVVANAERLAAAPLGELVLSDPYGTPLDAPEATRLYRPLATLSWAMQTRVAGASPRALHLADMLLHASCAILVALMFVALVRDARWAFAATSLFAVHPAASETVCSVVGRGDLLAATFLAGALTVLAREAPSVRSWGRAASAVILVAAAVCSSELALSFVLVLVVFDVARAVAQRRSVGTREIAVWAGAAAAAAAYLAVRHALLGTLAAMPETSPADDPLARAPLGARLGSASWLFVTALRLILVPFGYSHVYGRGTVAVASGLFDPRSLAGAGLIAALVAAAVFILVRRRDAVPLIALSMFALPLGLALAARALAGAPFTERRLYVAAIGVGLAAAWWLARAALEGKKATIVRAGAVVAAVLFMALTFSRVDAWRSVESLSRAALRLHADAPVLWRAVGAAELGRGDAESAARSLQRAVAGHDADEDAWRLLGAAWTRLDRHADAARALNRTIELSGQGDAATWRALGRAELASRRFRRALTALKKARDLAPADPKGRPELFQALLHVAEAELEDDRDDEAARLVDEALAMEDVPAEARFRAALILEKAGRMDEAIDAYESILLEQPDQAPTLFNLGRALLLAGRPREAIAPLERGLAVRDDDRARALLEEAKRQARAGDSR